MQPLVALPHCSTDLPLSNALVPKPVVKPASSTLRRARWQVIDSANMFGTDLSKAMRASKAMRYLGQDILPRHGEKHSWDFNALQFDKEEGSVGFGCESSFRLDRITSIIKLLECSSPCLGKISLHLHCLFELVSNIAVDSMICDLDKLCSDAIAFAASG